MVIPSDFTGRKASDLQSAAAAVAEGMGVGVVVATAVQQCHIAVLQQLRRQAHPVEVIIGIARDRTHLPAMHKP